MRKTKETWEESQRRLGKIYYQYGKRTIEASSKPQKTFFVRENPKAENS